MEQGMEEVLTKGDHDTAPANRVYTLVFPVFNVEFQEILLEVMELFIAETEVEVVEFDMHLFTTKALEYLSRRTLADDPDLTFFHT